MGAKTTQAGTFVHEEIHKIRRGEHWARSPQHVIAIGRSKARRVGVVPWAAGKRQGQGTNSQGRPIRLRSGSASAQTSSSTEARLLQRLRRPDQVPHVATAVQVDRVALYQLGLDRSLLDLARSLPTEPQDRAHLHFGLKTERWEVRDCWRYLYKDRMKQLERGEVRQWLTRLA